MKRKGKFRLIFRIFFLFLFLESGNFDQDNNQDGWEWWRKTQYQAGISVKSSWCGIIFIINRALAAAAGALGFWLHQQSTVQTETLTLYCCVKLSSALSEPMSSRFRRRRWRLPRCSGRWASDSRSVFRSATRPSLPLTFFICRRTDVSCERTRTHGRGGTDEHGSHEELMRW